MSAGKILSAQKNFSPVTDPVPATCSLLLLSPIAFLLEMSLKIAKSHAILLMKSADF